MAIGAACRPPSLASIAFLVLFLAGCASGSGGTSGAYDPHIGTYTVGAPYEIKGIWYYPAVDYDYDRTGIASWYGAGFEGRYTANGEIYDMNQLTAAHTTLPLPSIVQVTNLENGRSLQLRINDRGPFVDGRLIDVSRRCAQLLGFEAKGTASVRVKILKDQSIAAAEAAMRNAPEIMVAEAAGTGRAAVSSAEAPMPRQATSSSESRLPGHGPSRYFPSVPYTAPPGSLPIRETAREREAPATPVSRTPGAPLGVGTEPGKTMTGQIFIQAGAFSMSDNARRARSRIARLGSVRVTTASINGTQMYRVQLGPLADPEQAGRLLARVVNSGYPEARIVGD